MSRELPSDHRNLIPTPETALKRLASNLREARLLRSLLRLSRRAAQDRTSQQGKRNANAQDQIDQGRKEK